MEVSSAFLNSIPAGGHFCQACESYHNMFYGATVGANAALIDLNTSLRIHNYMFSEGLL